jgi:hypothetical protein
MGSTTFMTDMAKPPRPWIVTKHDPIEKLEDNLWVVAGNVPGLPFRRRMSIIRRSDGSLVFFNAIPLEDAELAEVRDWGKPAILVVPHDQHMIDARPFAEKLELKLYGPKECEAKIRARAELSGTLDALPSDPSFRVEPVAGVKNGEPALIVNSAGGHASLLLSDVIMNNPKKAIGFFPRMMGFAGYAKIVPVFKMMFLKDKKALKAQVSRWAELSGLARIVPCHGDLVSSSAPNALKSAAATL